MSCNCENHGDEACKKECIQVLLKDDKALVIDYKGEEVDLNSPRASELFDEVTLGKLKQSCQFMYAYKDNNDLSYVQLLEKASMMANQLDKHQNYEVAAMLINLVNEVDNLLQSSPPNQTEPSVN